MPTPSKSARIRSRLARLESCPKDYVWDEFSTLLGALGFKESSSGGSARCFRHREQKHHVIHLHKPHGRNPPTILVVYLKKVVAKLKEWGYFDE